jgi:integrase
MIIKNDWPRIRPPTDKLKWWTVDPRPFYPREYFRNQAAAKGCAHKLKIKAHNFKQVQQSEIETLHSNVAVEKLKEHGVNLIEAAEFWIKQNALIEPTSVSKVIDAWLEFKRSRFLKGELKRNSFKNLSSCIRYFRNPFGSRMIHTLGREELAKWVDEIAGSKINRHNIRRIAMNLLNWGVERGYLKDNLLRFKKVEITRNKVVHILSVQECSDLLASSKNTGCYAYVLLCLFAGMRPEEVQRLKWGLFENGQVHIKESKTGPRFVTLLPDLWKALMKLKKKGSEKIIPSDFRNKFDETRADAGWIPTANLLRHVGIEKAQTWKGKREWKPDCMRHSFASYWLPIHHSYAELAGLMGNSERVIKEDYRRAVPIGEVEAFWKLLKTSLASLESSSACASKRRSSSRGRYILPVTV